MDRSDQVMPDRAPTESAPETAHASETASMKENQDVAAPMQRDSRDKSDREGRSEDEHMSGAASGAGAPHSGMSGWLASVFVRSKLTPLLLIASVLLGVGAVALLPREEEPQIKVPMIDVMVSMPGSNPKEVEERVTRPMEQLLWEIPGVEYVYSTSREGSSLVIVRFKVGENLEQSVVNLQQKLRTNYDRIPHGVSEPLIKPRTINDVPILAVTLHSSRYDHLMLRRLAAQLQESVKQVPNVAETMLIGGARRQVRVQVDPVRLASRGLSVAGIVPMLQQANREMSPGALTTANQEVLVKTGSFLQSAEDVGQVVLGVFGGKPVYVRDVATISDGPEELAQYVLFGHAGKEVAAGEEPAVTLTVAKRPGTNAVHVADQVLHKIGLLRGTMIPQDVQVTTTRNYGETAAEKSNELLFHMGLAIIGVAILIGLMLGWREAGIVGLAIPATLALTLVVFLAAGYTLNRITLFALIFSIGILVDDAIVVVENIVRHYHLPRNRGRALAQVAVEAAAEVGNPTILATWAVIAAIAPMAFVGGLMGPYMRPIPVGASAAMIISLLVAFIATPWAAVHLLRTKKGIIPEQSAEEASHATRESFLTRGYRAFMSPLINHWWTRWTFLILVTALLLGAMALVYTRHVQVKMLPFDNKSEFQVVLNMPEGSSLELTAQAAREIAEQVKREPEVRDYQVYAGTSSPFNFNGLVRHYFMRQQANMADIQVNLAPKGERKAQSHDIALRVRPRIASIARHYGARVAVAEVPPGPPVLQTLVAEAYAPTTEARTALAARMRDIFRQTPGVVDVDWYAEADQPLVRYVVDKEKAALHGISAQTIAETLRIATIGQSVDLVHFAEDREDVNLVVEVPRSMRTSPEELLNLRVRSGDANALPEPGTAASAPPLIPLREVVHLERSVAPKSIYHKNLMPVIYVTGDVAGEIESPVYAIARMNEAVRKLDAKEFGGAGTGLRVYNISMPFTDQRPAMKWDGEWQITLEVFRDLGLAFAVALVLIYLLMTGWFSSFMVPVIVMAAIPFSLIGILPAHAGMHAFFSATSMIGFMAGAGIVVRNSIILVDFIELRRREGMPLAEAVVDAGAVRFRPMLLTALAVVVGSAVILFDPIFQGLALALMAGEVASLLVSRMAVPVLYYMARARSAHGDPGHSRQQESLPDQE